MPEPLASDALLDPVVKHMRGDFVQLRAAQTVGEALESIQAQQPEGRIIYFYIADAVGRLVGVVPTRRLLLNPRDRRLGDIMVTPVVQIPHSAMVLDACEFFVLHKLLAFPVVDDDRRMIGLVDVDLYTRELSDLDRRDDSDHLFQLIGVHLSEAQRHSPVAAFRGRFPWLLANIAGGILAALLAWLFRFELERAIGLSLFIPVVLALAESVCIQSVSLTLKTQNAGRKPWSLFLKRIVSELTAGALLGVACGLIVGLAALGWLWQPSVALCILGGIAGGVSVAAVLGMAIPHLLHLLKRDPQVAAGPIALALTDMATLLIYLTLARLLLAGSGQ
ncbi:MAG: magnesium transporter [Planctomycetes bacterium]|nr:magnesium transporter [Planctomycetota bacterium]